MRSAIYARYSSSLQRPTSIADQIALCRQAAQRLDYTVAEEHIYVDQEISGSVAQRPGYQRLLDAAKCREFHAVIVESQDRLWRDQAEMHTALRRFRFWDVKVISAATGTELTERTGKLIASVKGWMDEAFLEDLRDKVRRGMLGQVQRGYSPGGQPYGYRAEPITDPTRTDPYGRPLIVGSRRVIDPDEAAVVRRIFELFVAGLSPDAIAQQLNREGVSTPRWRNGIRMPGWVPSTIRGQKKLAYGILRNPIYIGKQVWNRTEKVRDPDTGRRIWRLHPPEQWIYVDVPELRIISNELWETAQRRLATSPYSAKQSAGRKPVYLLSGLCICGQCGSAYVVVSGRGWYGCGGYFKRGETVCTNRLLVKRVSLEERILSLVQEQMLAPAAVAHFVRHFDRVLKERLRRQAPSERNWKRELAQAEAELENVKAAIRAGIITRTTRAMLEETEAKVERLGLKMSEPAPAQTALRMLPTMAAKFVEDVCRLAQCNVPKGRILLQEFVGRIVLRPNGATLVAVVQGNLAALLPVEGRLLGDNRGAGGRS